MNPEQIAKQILTQNSSLKQVQVDAFHGNESCQNSLVMGLQLILKTKQQPSQQKLAFKKINQLILSAQPGFIHKISDKLFPVILQKHRKTPLSKQQENYIILWARILNGSQQKSEYPNAAQIFKPMLKETIKSQTRQLPTQFKNSLWAFQKALVQKQNKKIQFFEDLEQDFSSFASESGDNDHYQEGIYLEALEIQKMKNRVQQGPLPKEMAEAYLKKAQHFLDLQASFDSSATSLKVQYNQERAWAKHYIQNYQKYIGPGMPTFRKEQNNERQRHPTQLQIQLKNQSQHMESKPRAEGMMFRKTKQGFASTPKRGDHQHFQVRERNMPTQQPVARQLSFNNPPKNQMSKDSSKLSFKDAINEDTKLLRMPPETYKTGPMKNNTPENSQSRISSTHKHAMFYQKIVPPSDNQDFQDQDVEIQIVKYNPKANLTEKIGFDQSPIHDIHALSQHNNQSYFNSTPGKFKKSYSKRLSEFASEKRVRRQVAPIHQLSEAQNYVIKPYSDHFTDLLNFARFRRNCFEQAFTLYSSSSLLVNCVVKRNSSSALKVEVSYINQSKHNLAVNSVYKIPRCFSVQKKSKIHKKFILTEEIITHLFILQLLSFPLETCLLSLRYAINYQADVQIPIPITIKNFIEPLMVTRQEWTDLWEYDNCSLKLHKNTFVDRNVISLQQLKTILQQYVDIDGVQGYSVEEFGSMCQYSGLNEGQTSKNLTFLIRISVRVDNLVSLQLVPLRTTTQTEKDFLDYYLGILTMLIMKIQA